MRGPACPSARWAGCRTARRICPRASFGRMPRQVTPSARSTWLGERKVLSLSSRPSARSRPSATPAMPERISVIVVLGEHLPLRRRRLGQHARIGDREGLLLQCRLVAVEEALVEILVGLRVSLQFSQPDTRLGDLLRARRISPPACVPAPAPGFAPPPCRSCRPVRCGRKFAEDQAVDVLHLARWLGRPPRARRRSGGQRRPPAARGASIAGAGR